MLLRTLKLHSALHLMEDKKPHSVNSDLYNIRRGEEAKLPATRSHTNLFNLLGTGVLHLNFSTPYM